MILHSYPESKSLYIELSEQPAVDSYEAAPGIVVDIDAEGRVVGLDVDTTAESSLWNMIADIRNDRVAALKFVASN